jgi:hypothetical protein
MRRLADEAKHRLLVDIPFVYKMPRRWKGPRTSDPDLVLMIRLAAGARTYDFVARYWQTRLMVSRWVSFRVRNSKP